MNYKIEQKVNFLEDENGNQLEVNEINFQNGTIEDEDFQTNEYVNEYYFNAKGVEIDMEYLQGNGWEIIDCDFNEEDTFTSEIEAKLTYSDLVNQVVNEVYFK